MKHLFKRIVSVIICMALTLTVFSQTGRVQVLADGFEPTVYLTVSVDPSTISQNPGEAFTAFFNMELFSNEPTPCTACITAFSGSREVEEDGITHVTLFTTDESGYTKVQFFVSVKSAYPDPNTSPESNELPLNLFDEGTFYVRCLSYAPNIPFKKDNGEFVHDILVKVNCKGSVEQMPDTLHFDIAGNTGLPTDDYVTEQKLISGPVYGPAIFSAKRYDEQSAQTGDTVYLTEMQKNLIKWGVIDSVDFIHSINQCGEWHLENPALLFTPDGTFSGLLPPMDHFQPIQAANDDQGEYVLVPVSGYGNVNNSIFTPPGYGETPATGGGRVIQASTYQFIVNRSDGTNESEWYNYSYGYKPVANSNEDYNNWDWFGMVPRGGYDMSKDTRTPEPLSKGDVIDSLTFDGGMAYYPLRMFVNHSASFYSVHTFWNSIFGWQLYGPCGTWESSFFRNDLYPEWQTLQEIYPFSAKEYPIVASFSRSAAPVVESVKRDAGGLVIDGGITIVVRYSEPAQPTTQLFVGDRILTPEESTPSNVQTFIWEVDANHGREFNISNIVAMNLDGEYFAYNA